MHGWKGKILSIDLDTGSFETIEPGIDTYIKFIGGKGLAGYYLKPHVTESWDSPEMPLLFLTGPLVDTPSPTSGRMTIMSRSPLTGTIGDTSVGGKLGTEIKRAGYDGIIITGKRKELSGIIINDCKVEIRSATDMAGFGISKTFSSIKEGTSKVAIGPAAENGVLFSNIAIDSHYFSGRNGLGLIMADKNIKYISVTGSGKTECCNMDEVMAAREEIFRLVSASPILKGELGISEYGTGALYDLTDSRRMMPTDNFRKTHFPHAGEMNAWKYKEKYLTKKTGCAGCHILCKKMGKDNTIIPEFETMSHFSALLSNSDIETVIEANNICNDLGMDTISAAVTLSAYAEIEGKKLSSGEIISLLTDTGFSRNTGNELKLGSYRYSEMKKNQGSSITVKKQELSAYDPRGAYGMALGFAISTRGACHLRAYPINHEILRKPVSTDRFTFSGKARIVKLNEDLNSVIDSLTACKFTFFAATLEEYSRALSGATGIDFTAQDLMETGERIYYNERIMNSLNGFSARDDDLPSRFFSEPGSSGNGIEIPPINRKDFLKARENYYKIRGVDKNGMPLRETVRKLGLE